MPPITYIPSNNDDGHFFWNSFTYIPSNEPLTPVLIPASIFSSGLSALEAVTKFLKENKDLRFCDIAKMLNRDDRTIWDAYDAATKKQSNNLDTSSQVLVPVTVFADRALSMLESLTGYLKEQLEMRYCKIAQILNKDARTIWTVYNRLQKKRKNAQ